MQRKMKIMMYMHNKTNSIIHFKIAFVFMENFEKNGIHRLLLKIH